MSLQRGTQEDTRCVIETKTSLAHVRWLLPSSHAKSMPATYTL
jgi:hypothetical protein